MASPLTSVQSDLELPLVFRTTTEKVYRSTTDTGEIWLRSDEYFRKFEDKVRNDELESLSAGKHRFPLRLPSGPLQQIEGDGHLAESLAPHYILSLHGTSIAEPIRQEFGGFTFGVTSIDLLARHVFSECSKRISCHQWNWNQVVYQHSALRISADEKGAPFQFANDPSRCLRIYNPHAFKKRPVYPFTEQDEWRIVIWTNGYLNEDPNAPFKVRVPPSLFYRYLEGSLS
jgi:hypothetical protein